MENRRTVIKKIFLFLESLGIEINSPYTKDQTIELVLRLWERKAKYDSNKRCLIAYAKKARQKKLKESQ